MKSEPEYVSREEFESFVEVVRILTKEVKNQREDIAKCAEAIYENSNSILKLTELSKMLIAFLPKNGK